MAFPAVLGSRSRGLHDWRLEITENQPVSKMLGFSWVPAPYTLLANDPNIVRHILKDEFNKPLGAQQPLEGYKESS